MTGVRRVRWWAKLPGAGRAAWTYLRTPRVRVDETVWAELTVRAARLEEVQTEADLLAVQTRALEVARQHGGALLSELDALPLNAAGDLHEPALIALLNDHAFAASVLSAGSGV